MNILQPSDLNQKRGRYGRCSASHVSRVFELPGKWFKSSFFSEHHVILPRTQSRASSSMSDTDTAVTPGSADIRNEYICTDEADVFLTDIQ